MIYIEIQIYQFNFAQTKQCPAKCLMSDPPFAIECDNFFSHIYSRKYFTKRYESL